LNLKLGSIFSLFINNSEYKSKLKTKTPKDEYIFEILEKNRIRGIKEEGELVCKFKYEKENYFFYGNFTFVSPDILIVDRKSEIFKDRRKEERYKVNIKGEIADKRNLKIVKVDIVEISINAGKIFTNYPLKINKDYEIEMDLPEGQVFSQIEIKNFQEIDGNEYFGFVFLNISFENFKKIENFIKSLKKEEYEEIIPVRKIEKPAVETKKEEIKEDLKFNEEKIHLNLKFQILNFLKSIFNFLNKPLPKFLNIFTVLIFFSIFFIFFHFYYKIKVDRIYKELKSPKLVLNKKKEVKVMDEKKEIKVEEGKEKGKKENENLEAKKVIFEEKKEKGYSELVEKLKSENVNSENLEEIISKYKFPVYYNKKEKFISLRTISLILGMNKVKDGDEYKLFEFNGKEIEVFVPENGEKYLKIDDLSFPLQKVVDEVIISFENAKNMVKYLKE